MLAVIDPTLGVVIGGAITALGAYLLAARRFSGHIGSSEAKDLWDESRAIREWSSVRIKELDEKVATLEHRVEVVESQIADRDATIVGLRAEIVELTTELKAARERVIEMEGRPDAR